jgi:hypothetical protein
MRAGAPGQLGELKPPADARQAGPLAMAIPKQMTLGGNPYAVGDVHRERLGHAPAKVRRGVEMSVGCVLERFARQS